MTTVKRRLADRRARNRVLAAQDAANRCAFCRRELPTRGVYERADDPGRRFCSRDHWQEQAEIDEMMKRV